MLNNDISAKSLLFLNQAIKEIVLQTKTYLNGKSIISSSIFHHQNKTQSQTKSILSCINQMIILINQFRTSKQTKIIIKQLKQFRITNTQQWNQIQNVVSDEEINLFMREINLLPQGQKNIQQQQNLNNLNQRYNIIFKIFIYLLNLSNQNDKKNQDSSEQHKKPSQQTKKLIQKHTIILRSSILHQKIYFIILKFYTKLNSKQIIKPYLLNSIPIIISFTLQFIDSFNKLSELNDKLLLQNQFKQCKRYLLQILSFMYNIFSEEQQRTSKQITNLFILIDLILQEKVSKINSQVTKTYSTKQNNIHNQSQNQSKSQGKSFFGLFNKSPKTDKNQKQKSFQTDKNHKNTTDISAFTKSSKINSFQEVCQKSFNKSKCEQNKAYPLKSSTNNENGARNINTGVNIYRNQTNFLSCDQSQIIKFYKNSLIEQVFKLQFYSNKYKKQSACQVIREFVRIYLNISYERYERENSIVHILRNKHKQTLKHIEIILHGIIQQNTSSQHIDNYQIFIQKNYQLLQLVNQVCSKQLLLSNQTKLLPIHPQRQNIFNPLVGFVICIYQTVMISHKNRKSQNQILSSEKQIQPSSIVSDIQFNGNRFSFSENIREIKQYQTQKEIQQRQNKLYQMKQQNHQNQVTTQDQSNQQNQLIQKNNQLSLKIQKSYQILKNVNIEAIQILSVLVKSKSQQQNKQIQSKIIRNQEKCQSISQLNTLLTLHQIVLNQVHFQRNFDNQAQQQQPIQSKSLLKQLKQTQYFDYFNSVKRLSNSLLFIHEQITYKRLKQYKKNCQHSQSLSKQQSTLQLYQQHEQLILSYQNIVAQSLQQIGIQLQDTIYPSSLSEGIQKQNLNNQTNCSQLNRNKNRQVLTILFKYVSNIMSLIYRNNQAASQITIKNNVMNSLKITKVLEIFIVFFWQHVWDMNKRRQCKQGQTKLNSSTEYEQCFLKQSAFGYLKLLHKFCIPKSQNQQIDYRKLKSTLIISQLLNTYSSMVTNNYKHIEQQNSQQSSPLSTSSTLSTFQQNNKVFLTTIIKIGQKVKTHISVQKNSSNIQLRNKVQQHVISRLESIILYPLNMMITSNQSMQVDSYRHLFASNFQILIQMLILNYTSQKQRLSDIDYSQLLNNQNNSQNTTNYKGNSFSLGEQKLVIELIHYIYQSINKNLLTLSLQTIKSIYSMISQTKLQQAVVIIEMYLHKQKHLNPLIDKKNTINTTQTHQHNWKSQDILKLAEITLQQIVLFKINSFMFINNNNRKLKSIIFESHYTSSTKYLQVLKQSLNIVNSFIQAQENQLQERESLSINEYFEFFSKFLQKIIKINSLLHCSTECQDTKLQFNYQVLTIFNQIQNSKLILNNLKVQNLIFINNLYGQFINCLQKYQKNQKYQKVTKSFVFQIKLISRLCQQKSDNNKPQFKQHLSNNIQSVFYQLGESINNTSAQNDSFRLLKNFNECNIFRSLLLRYNTPKQKQTIQNTNQNTNYINCYISSINNLFIKCSQVFIPSHKTAYSNLSVLDTPTFKVNGQRKPSNLPFFNVNKQNLQIQQGQQQQEEQNRNTSFTNSKYGKYNQFNQEQYEEQEEQISEQSQNKEVIVSQLQIMDDDNKMNQVTEEHTTNIDFCQQENTKINKNNKNNQRNGRKCIQQTKNLHIFQVFSVFEQTYCQIINQINDFICGTKQRQIYNNSQEYQSFESIILTVLENIKIVNLRVCNKTNKLPSSAQQISINLLRVLQQMTNINNLKVVIFINSESVSQFNQQLRQNIFIILKHYCEQLVSQYNTGSSTQIQQNLEQRRNQLASILSSILKSNWANEQFFNNKNNNKQTQYQNQKLNQQLISILQNLIQHYENNQCKQQQSSQVKQLITLLQSKLIVDQFCKNVSEEELQKAFEYLQNIRPLHDSEDRLQLLRGKCEVVQKYLLNQYVSIIKEQQKQNQQQQNNTFKYNTNTQNHLNNLQTTKHTIQRIYHIFKSYIQSINQSINQGKGSNKLQLQSTNQQFQLQRHPQQSTILKTIYQVLYPTLIQYITVPSVNIAVKQILKMRLQLVIN